jgi:acetylglutamate kinase
VGLTGKDGSLIEAVKYRGENGKGGVDFGLVGEVEKVNPEVVEALLDRFVPVIAPLGVGADGNTYNINADLAAGKIASAMGAAKFIILTDVEGVKDKNGTLLHTLTSSQAKRLIEEGVIAGGMIPKVRCCIHALEEGAKQAHIIDGRVEHSVLLEIFTDSGIGTQIIKD